MNTFVTFERVALLNAVSIYSVIIHHEESPNNQTEYAKFQVKVADDASLRADLEEINAQLAVIGDRGTSTFAFRHETKAFALPAKDRRLVSTGFIPAAEHPLRLYFVLLPDDVMVLCNGGAKTADRAQDCPQVRPHFQFSNRLMRLLHRRLEEEQRPIKHDTIEYILENETLTL